MLSLGTGTGETVPWKGQSIYHPLIWSLSLFVIFLICIHHTFPSTSSEFLVLPFYSHYELIFGGILSGGLHAVSGPDHLASLLPCIIGQQWSFGMRMGWIWGLGHGITSLTIGMIGFSLKDYVFQTDMNYLMCIKNIALGGTLLVIGAMGVREALHNKPEEDDDTSTSPNSDFVPQITGFSRRKSVYLTYFLNGCIMGLTWDGLPSLAPSVALPEFSSVMVFLVCYCFGTAFFMSLVSGIVSHASILLGDIAGSSFPVSLALIASIISIVSGGYWLLYAGVVAVVGDDESLTPYRTYFSCLAVFCSALSSIIAISSYAHRSPLGAALLTPLAYYWKILTTGDIYSHHSSKHNPHTMNKYGIHTV
jgi:hypothetical protein